MFNADNNEEKKLDWMYKGPNSTVDREEYLLGRSVDKTLEQINDEDKQKQSGISAPKNRVEHECIPPSIRDVNKIVVEAVQVDMSAKLQEDPLVAIQKRMEETRREFLQNPVQLKKLQKALESQKAKKHKKDKKKKKAKKSDDKESDFNDKVKLLKSGLLGTKLKKRKPDQEETDLDTILIHKFNALKSFLTDDDLREVLNCEVSGGSSDEMKNVQEMSSNDEANDSSHDEQNRRKYNQPQPRPQPRQNPSMNPKPQNDRRRRRSSSTEKRRRGDSSDSDSSKPKKNWGLVTSDGAKIALNKRSNAESSSRKSAKKPEAVKTTERSSHTAKKMTDEEKDKLRKEMMANAQWRDKERERNVKRYRETDEKEKKTEKDFDTEFAHKQLLKTTAGSSVESRIKANLNKIQRSSRDMEKHFSRR